MIEDKNQEFECSKQDHQRGAKWKVGAVVFGGLLILPLYGTFLSLYLLNMINAFVYVGALIVMSFILSAFLFLYRKKRGKNLIIGGAALLSFILLVYDFTLVEFESNTLQVSAYAEPEDLLGDSGIHVLTVWTQDIYYADDREWIREGLELEDVEVLEIYQVTNLLRYRGKQTYLKNFFTSPKEPFQVMAENVNAYVGKDLEFLTTFLSRTDISGDSAGLALGLTAKVFVGDLENHVPIGVTGTLEPNGEVNSVGMVGEKVRISEQKGLLYAIVPLGNLEDAELAKREYNLNIEVFGVEHIDEAVEVISGIQ
ncbi:S16 family serine protease [Evansella sp. AB-rgal1]|uniref:S16 family serine protease n=1 Tax=Evansella sp. AB-rgal1 TaxID=3242696 RepID=UPI00359EE705